METKPQHHHGNAVNAFFGASSMVWQQLTGSRLLALSRQQH
jgi:hypothetical protein